MALRASLGLSSNIALLLAATALGQPTFSIDYQGPPKGTGDTCPPAMPITHADILLPTGGVPPALGFTGVPCISVSGGLMGLALPTWPPPVPPGAPGTVEVDALSYGVDSLLRPNDAPTTITWYFSVNEFAVGLPGPAPNVASQSAVLEAAADVFATTGLGPGPFCGGPIAGNLQVYDGNGLGGTRPGLGLLEPLPPAPGIPVGGEPGSNLDALDMDTPPGTYPIYFSLDSAFIDAAEALPNTGSALANGFGSGANVLMRTAPPPTGITVIYAGAFLLGLDLAGPGTDDLDALVLHENGVPGFQPPTNSYSWLNRVAPTDMLIFSVRAGSLVIGVPDSFCGIPITPNDLLIPPATPGLPPRRFIPGAVLGLAVMDELDALDVVVDCNGNGISDIRDVLVGGMSDCNNNLIPDSCETDCNSNGKPDDCDLNPADPDGNGSTSPDCNGNFIPDECEVMPLCLNPGNTCHDCQPNGKPDDCDLNPSDPDGNGQVSANCNGDAIPDECQIPPDCNNNGVVDNCEPDCNGNGIPDDCDINPSDPDGNGQVSANCNGNSVPDECEVAVGPIGFAAVVPYTATGASDSIVAADLDGDRDLDLVWPNFNTDNITIRWNDGAGSYPTTTNVNVGDGPVSVAVGDMNNDTDLDIVVVNRNARTVTVLQNNGLGTAWLPSTMNVSGTGPQNIVLADFDRDGRLDLAVTNPNDNNIRILIVGGFGTTVLSNNIVPVGGNPIGIAVGDYFLHGHLAIAVANFGSNSITVLHPDPTGGTYHVWATFQVDTGPYAVAFGDVDGRSGSGSPSVEDIIVAHAPTGSTSANNVSILPYPIFDGNTGNWVLPYSPVIYPVGTLPSAISLADLDRDGDLDIVAACRGSGGNGAGAYVLRNTTNLISMSFSSAVVFDPGTTERNLAVGNLNGDGYPDLALQGTTAARVMLSNYGSSSLDRNANGRPDECESDCNGNGIVDALDVDPPLAFEHAPHGLTNGGGEFVWLSDLDNDGDLDALTTSSQASTPLMMLLNNGDGAFPTRIEPTGLPPQGLPGIAVGRINADTLLDVACADSWNGRILVLRNTMSSGVLTFAAPQIVASGITPGVLAGGDLDGDGDFDLVFTDGSNDRIGILRNTTAGGTISYAAPTYVTTGDLPLRVYVANMDSDSDLDLLVIHYLTFDLRIYSNNGSGTFALSNTYFSGTRPISIDVGDLNLDNRPDVVLALQDSNNVTVRLNTGTGALGAPQEFVAGASPGSPAIGDFDGDGRPDIAVSNYMNTLQDSIAVLTNNGNTTFTAPVQFDTQHYTANALVAADVDRDGRMDLAVRAVGSVYGLMNRTLHVGTAPQTFTATPGTPIPSGPGQVTTPALPITAVQTIEDLDVRVNITHPFPGSLSLVLIHPNGTSVTLAQERSGFGSGFINTVFDEGAGYSFMAAQAPLTGRFRPSPGTLSALRGKPAAGGWLLRVIDSSPGDVGTIVDWSLTFRWRVPGCGDLTGDGVVNGGDAQAFTNCQIAGSATGACQAADLDGDGDVDAADLALFIAALLA